jgi:hypothetical protein
VTAAVAVGAIGLALTRRDGLLWLAILAVVLAPVTARPLVASLQRRGRRIVVAIASAIAAFVLIAAVWARPTLSRFTRNWQNGDGTTWWEAARYIRTYFVQAVGVFGWLDSPIGEEAFLVAMVLTGFVVLLALVSTHRRLVASTALAVAALIVTPVAFGLVRFPYLQGRYLLPIWVGTLLIAGASASFGDTGVGFNRRASRLVLAAWAAVHLIAGIQNLRRYAVGRSGSWNFLTDADWHPDTMPNWAAAGAYVVAVTIAVVGFAVVLREVDPSGDPSVEPATEPGSR